MAERGTSDSLTLAKRPGRLFAPAPYAYMPLRRKTAMTFPKVS